MRMIPQGIYLYFKVLTLCPSIFIHIVRNPDQKIWPQTFGYFIKPIQVHQFLGIMVGLNLRLHLGMDRIGIGLKTYYEDALTPTQTILGAIVFILFFALLSKIQPAIIRLVKSIPIRLIQKKSETL